VLADLARAGYNLSNAYSTQRDVVNALAMQNKLTELAQLYPDEAVLREFEAKSALNIAIDEATPDNLAGELFETIVKLALEHPDESVLREQQARYEADLILKSCGGPNNADLVPDKYQLEAAQSHYQTVFSLLATDSALPSAREVLGRAAGSLIRCYGRARQIESALAIFDKVITPLAAAHPEHGALRRTQALAANDLMVCFARGGDLKRAHQTLDQVIVRLVADHPEQPELLDVQGLATRNLAVLYGNFGEKAKAEKLFSDFSLLVEAFPERQFLRSLL
jgi:pentatricopeptide repeat protein